MRFGFCQIKLLITFVVGIYMQVNIMSSYQNRRKVGYNIPSVAFPSSLIHNFHSLRTLYLQNCEGVEVVFEIESSESRELGMTRNNQQPLFLPYLEVLDMQNMDDMTHVWKCDRKKLLISLQEPKSSAFHNLTNVRLFGCNRMKYLFSPLMAKLLSNLNNINIDCCDAIEEVVSNIDDEYEEIATSIFSHTDTTFFPHLDILDLSRLKSLKCIQGVAATRLSSVDAMSVHDKLQVCFSL